MGMPYEVMGYWQTEPQQDIKESQATLIPNQEEHEFGRLPPSIPVSIIQSILLEMVYKTSRNIKYGPGKTLNPSNVE